MPLFLIQNTQNRDARAIHLKVDELLRTGEKARNYLIDLQNMSDEELDELELQFKIWASKKAGTLCPNRRPNHLRGASTNRNGRSTSRRASASVLFWVAITIVAFALQVTETLADSTSDSSQGKGSTFNFDSVRNCVWDTDVGNGFRKHATEAGILVGGGFGMRVFGGTEDHNMVLGTVHVGTMLSGLVAREHFWRGNFELLGDFFGGEQYHNIPRPQSLSSVLRQFFGITSQRAVQIRAFYWRWRRCIFLTDIRGPGPDPRHHFDFNFNVQVSTGVHWFFKPNVAATLEGRWLHLSNAGIKDPNEGVNAAQV